MTVIKSIKIVVEDSRFYKGLCGIGFLKNHKKTKNIEKYAQNVHKKFNLFQNTKNSVKSGGFQIGILKSEKILLISKYWKSLY